MNKSQKIIEQLGKGTNREGSGGTDTCVCPKCSKEVSHKRGIPCNKLKCSECGTVMTGKGAVGDLTK